MNSFTYAMAFLAISSKMAFASTDLQVDTFSCHTSNEALQQVCTSPDANVLATATGASVYVDKTVNIGYTTPSTYALTDYKLLQLPSGYQHANVHSLQSSTLFTTTGPQNGSGTNQNGYDYLLAVPTGTVYPWMTAAQWTRAKDTTGAIDVSITLRGDDIDHDVDFDVYSLSFKGKMHFGPVNDEHDMMYFVMYKAIGTSGAAPSTISTDKYTCKVNKDSGNTNVQYTFNTNNVGTPAALPSPSKWNSIMKSSDSMVDIQMKGDGRYTALRFGTDNILFSHAKGSSDSFPEMPSPGLLLSTTDPNVVIITHDQSGLNITLNKVTDTIANPDRIEIKNIDNAMKSPYFIQGQGVCVRDHGTCGDSQVVEDLADLLVTDGIFNKDYVVATSECNPSDGTSEDRMHLLVQNAQLCHSVRQCNLDTLQSVANDKAWTLKDCNKTETEIEAFFKTCNATVPASTATEFSCDSQMKDKCENTTVHTMDFQCTQATVEPVDLISKTKNVTGYMYATMDFQNVGPAPTADDVTKCTTKNTKYEAIPVGWEVVPSDVDVNAVFDNNTFSTTCVFAGNKAYGTACTTFGNSLYAAQPLQVDSTIHGKHCYLVETCTQKGAPTLLIRKKIPDVVGNQDQSARLVSALTVSDPRLHVTDYHRALGGTTEDYPTDYVATKDPQKSDTHIFYNRGFDGVEKNAFTDLKNWFHSSMLNPKQTSVGSEVKELMMKKNLVFNFARDATAKLHYLCTAGTGPAFEEAQATIEITSASEDDIVQFAYLHNVKRNDYFPLKQGKTLTAKLMFEHKKSTGFCVGPLDMSDKNICTKVTIKDTHGFDYVMAISPYQRTCNNETKMLKADITGQADVVTWNFCPMHVDASAHDDVCPAPAPAAYKEEAAAGEYTSGSSA
jgi:hypothetical protein